VPESLRAYLPDGVKTIQHDRAIFAVALNPELRIGSMDEDPRIQIYRISIDMFLSWLCLVASALERQLFQVADMQDVGYWVAKIQSEVVVHRFIVGYGYQQNIDKLIAFYRTKDSPYRKWMFPVNLTSYQQAARTKSETGDN
jgi:hypothetical protein